MQTDDRLRLEAVFRQGATVRAEEMQGLTVGGTRCQIRSASAMPTG